MRKPGMQGELRTDRHTMANDMTPGASCDVLLFFGVVSAGRETSRLPAQRL